MMKTMPKNKKPTLIIGVGTAEDHFKRSMARAKKMDRGEKIPAEWRFTFEDPADFNDYIPLLIEIQPKVIQTKKEHKFFLSHIERLMLKGEGKGKRTPAENQMLKLLGFLVHEYEVEMYPIEHSTPAEMLEFMMEQGNKKASDLPLPAKRVSEILSGKRSVSIEQAKQLGKFFHISPALFLDL